MAKQAPFPLRMPPEMMATIRDRATLRGVSVNAELVGLLAQALGMDAPDSAPPVGVDFEGMIRRAVSDELDRRGV